MKEIAMAGGRVALVDDEDYPKMSGFRWHVVSGYAMRAERRRKAFGGDGSKQHFLMHRELFGLCSGDRRCVDHINHDKLDNRRANLRVCTYSENAKNRHPRSQSGFLGVIEHWPGRWSAKIRLNATTVICLGTFGTPVDAARAYDKAAREHHGAFACPNFPEP